VTTNKQEEDKIKTSSTFSARPSAPHSIFFWLRNGDPLAPMAALAFQHVDIVWEPPALKALLRLCQCSFKTLLRPCQGSFTALLGSIKALLHTPPPKCPVCTTAARQRQAPRTCPQSTARAREHLLPAPGRAGCVSIGAFVPAAESVFVLWY